MPLTPKLPAAILLFSRYIKNFKLDGTSKIVLTGRQAGVIEKTKLDAIKNALLGNDGNGLVEIKGATLSNTDAGITGSTATFDTAQGNSGVSGIYENNTITGANQLYQAPTLGVLLS